MIRRWIARETEGLTEENKRILREDTIAAAKAISITLFGVYAMIGAFISMYVFC